VSGRYFDGFKEIPSSEESRDQQKARTVWEQSAKLVGLSPDDSIYFSPASRKNTATPVVSA
jgi:hypothetical protein